MPESYFATGYVRLLYRVLQAERLSAQALFQNTGCCADDLMRADFEMPFTAQMQFCRNALALAPPGLGLRSGPRLQIAAHGALGTVIQSAPDLHTALETFAELIAARASFYSLTLSRQGRTAQVEITMPELPKDLVPFFSESICFTIAHCLTFYSGERQNMFHCQLSYEKPEYAADYGHTLGSPVSFGGSQTLIAFSAGLLTLPSPEADPVVHVESVARCRGQISGRSPSRLAASVEHFLLENPGKLWSVEEIAPLFAVSARTLLRKLKAEGTTYQALRDTLLKRQAAIYLANMTVEATAISLGFSDTSSFRRTYKRWHGATPSEHR